MTGGVTKSPTATTSSMIGYGWRDGVIVAERVSLMAAPPLMNAATALSPEPDCRSRTDQNGCVRRQRRWREGVTAHLVAIARSNLCWPEMMSMVRDRRGLSNGRSCRASFAVRA
jgi:hypothetical protein